MIAVYLLSNGIPVSGQSTLNPDGTHTYFIATDGNDSNNGSISSPFATLMRAHRNLVAGDTVFIRGGDYKIPAAVVPATTDKSGLYADINYFDKAGTANMNICIWGYKGERPVFDFSEVKPANQRVTAFFVTGDYYYFKNFEVTGVQVTILTHTQSECFRNEDGNYNRYENLSMHDGQAIGFYLTNGIGNIVRNCDAYNNCDVTSEGGAGGNVDGFGCHPSRESGMGNKFIGCRAWLNSDDGYDLINAYAAVTFDSCWAFYNGYSKDAAGNLVSRGDGNGFKSGGYGMPDVVTKYPHDSIPHHIVEHCLAYYNKSSGFYANHHLGGNYYLNNSAYRNGTNFNMVNRKSPEEDFDVPGYDHVLINNLSYAPRSTGADLRNLDKSLSTDENNSFTEPVILGADDDFNSLDAAQLELSRQSGGQLPEIDFLTLRTDKFIDKGQDLGFPYYGAAPDLGYHETTVPPVIIPTDPNLNPDGTHTYFVAPDGSDDDNGTISAPFATIMFANGKIVPGDTVFIRGGRYKVAADVVAATMDGGKYFDVNFFNQKGSPDHNFYIWGYKNERPVFDFSDVRPAGQGVNAFYVTGSYYYFRNIEVTGLHTALSGENKASGFRNNRGNHNIFENLSVHDGQVNGFYITQGIGNLLHNCDAFNNYVDGGAVDGFVCQPSSTGGKNNQIIGCRAWHNSDDGFDLSFAYTSVILDSCWAFENGYSENPDGSLTVRGDGNGFKTGGYGMQDIVTKYPDPIPQHVIEHCLAYNNKRAGFYANDHLGGNLYYNNTAYKNDINFDMVNRKSVNENIEVAGYGHVLKNNISYSPRTADAEIVNLDQTLSMDTCNSFSAPMIAVTDHDFNSLDATKLTSDRKTDGGLPEVEFLTLKTNKLVDKGVNVGLEYNGNAPDLGYAESSITPQSSTIYSSSFNGHILDGKAVLHWATANETGNKGFEIQRSPNGIPGWQTIAFVSGHDDTENRKGYSYRFIDNEPLNTLTYYRLVQIVLSGAPHYSDAISLTPSGKQAKEGVILYPNPVSRGTSTITLRTEKAIEGKALVSIYNASGRVVYQSPLNGGSREYKVKLPSLIPGIYYLKVGTHSKIVASAHFIVNKN